MMVAEQDVDTNLGDFVAEILQAQSEGKAQLMSQLSGKDPGLPFGRVEKILDFPEGTKSE